LDRNIKISKNNAAPAKKPLFLNTLRIKKGTPLLRKKEMEQSLSLA
jgi:hypothetical protein